jgi:ferredoxin
MGIDVRRHVWLGEPVKESHCLVCGECVKRCPRGLLRLELVTPTGTLGTAQAR